MKILTYFSCMLLFVSCKGKQTAAVLDSSAVRDTVVKPDTATISTIKNLDTVFKQYKLIDDFIVTDSGYYAFVLGNSVYLVIHRNNKLIDTIDKYHNLTKVSNNLYLYKNVRTWPLEKDAESNTNYKTSRSGQDENYILFSNGRKTNLNQIANNFNDYFSSPSVINGKICFWGITESNNNKPSKISASIFDPINNKTESYYLFDSYIETDDEGYFTTPYLENGLINFWFGKNKIWKFSLEGFILKN